MTYIKSKDFETWIVFDKNGLLSIRCRCLVPMPISGKILDNTVVLGKVEIKTLKDILNK